MADWAVDEIIRVRDRGVVTDDPLVTIHDLLTEEIEQNWLVPGLLEYGDRMIVTAGEGIGKSTLLAQLAVCVASGTHPFRRHAVAPARVFVIDCENGRALLQRRFRHLRSLTERMGRPIEPDRFFIEPKPEGLDLADRQDARWFLRKVEKAKPDLLIVGPLYRLHRGDPNDEQTARQTAAVLDKARAVNGCALVAEGHAPHGNGFGKRPMRPVGSSLWLRWPEFGYGLQQSDDDHAKDMRLMDFTPWRQPRDVREWPKQIVAGPDWPWVEYTPLNAPLRAV